MTFSGKVAEVVFGSNLNPQKVFGNFYDRFWSVEKKKLFSSPFFKDFYERDGMFEIYRKLRKCSVLVVCTM